MRFLQFHLLTAHAPSNLNRDDANRPKTAVFGGEPRLRISSQSLKRAWRTSTAFTEQLAGHLAERTERLGRLIVERLAEQGVEPDRAMVIARRIAGSIATINPETDRNRALLLLGGEHQPRWARTARAGRSPDAPRSSASSPARSASCAPQSRSTCRSTATCTTPCAPTGRERP